MAQFVPAVIILVLDAVVYLTSPREVTVTGRGGRDRLAQVLI